MRPELWYIFLGTLLAGIAFTGSAIRRWPITTAMLYFAVGLGLGGQGLAILRLEPLVHAELLQRASEAAVLISLFTAGLKLRVPLRDRKWRLATRLAVLSMLVTVVIAACAGRVLLGLSWAASILLAGILSPTDPVLASEVQVDSPFDRNRLRFALTGEAGLNDTTAFPMVILGLHLLAQDRMAYLSLHWLAVDVMMPLAGGLAIGASTGTLLSRYVLHLRAEHGQALGYNDFLALGLLAVTYGIAELCHTYGFLAVFAAGFAVRGTEMRQGGHVDEDTVTLPLTEEGREELARDPEKGPLYLTQTMLAFNEHYERMAEFGVVTLFGVLFRWSDVSGPAVLYGLLLFFVARPVAVMAGLTGARATRREKLLMGWFGLRGIGSLYYIAYAMQHDLRQSEARTLTPVVFTVIALSIFVHGITVTPIMRRFRENS